MECFGVLRILLIKNLQGYEIIRTFAFRNNKKTIMPNIDRANKWLTIVAEDLVVAEDL